MDKSVQLMKITLDGEVVAELPLLIYDGAKAYEAFTASFSEIAQHVIGEIYQCVRIGCRPELKKQFGEYVALDINISSGIRPQLIVPNNFPPGGF